MVPELQRDLARVRQRLGMEDDAAKGTCPKGCQGDCCFTDAFAVRRLYHLGQDGKPLNPRGQIVPTPERTPESLLRDAKQGIMSTAEWRMKGWPEAYPDLTSALRYGQARDKRYTPDVYDYERAYSELIAEAGPSSHPVPEPPDLASDPRLKRMKPLVPDAPLEHEGEPEPDIGQPRDRSRRLVAGTPDEKHQPITPRIRST